MKNNHKTLNRRAFTLLLAILSLLATHNVTASHVEGGGNDPIQFDEDGHISQANPALNKNYIVQYNKIPAGNPLLTAGQQAIEDVLADKSIANDSNRYHLINTIIRLAYNAYFTEQGSFTAQELQSRIDNAKHIFNATKGNSAKASNSFFRITTLAQAIAKQQKAKEEAKKKTTSTADDYSSYADYGNYAQEDADKAVKEAREKTLKNINSAREDLKQALLESKNEGTDIWTKYQEIIQRHKFTKAELGLE